MPHIVIEYANSPTLKELLPEIMQLTFDAAYSTGLFTKNAIKVRAIAIDDFIMPDEQLYFVHLNARILNGRTITQKQQLSEALVNCLTPLTLSATEITVDVIDMEKDCYRKVLT